MRGGKLCAREGIASAVKVFWCLLICFWNILLVTGCKFLSVSLDVVKLRVMRASVLRQGWLYYIACCVVLIHFESRLRAQSVSIVFFSRKTKCKRAAINFAPRWLKKLLFGCAPSLWPHRAKLNVRALPTNIIKGWIISSHVKFLNYEAPGRCSFIAKEYTPLLIECFQSKSVIYWPRPTASILKSLKYIACNLIVLINEHWWILKNFHADGFNIFNLQIIKYIENY